LLIWGKNREKTIRQKNKGIKKIYTFINSKPRPMSYILTFDQGTSSSRAILFDKKARIAGISQKEFHQIYPEKNLVEQSPEEIYESQIEAAREVIKKVKISPGDIAAIGITNQRETTILWDKNTGKPVYNAIVWQDRRTRKYCTELQKMYSDTVHNKTGLVIDPYFSATKIRWILENVEGIKDRAFKGEILFGTVDTWLIWNLTGGKLHITDVSNASRTMLFNINAMEWDMELMQLFGIPEQIMPQVVDSSQVYGTTDAGIFGAEIPIASIAGDQQAALFGQLALKKGMMKNTFGTGCFMLMNTGSKPHFSNHRLLTTVAWRIDGKTTYALEGNIYIAGAAVKWMRDKLKIIETAAESQEMAESLSDSGGVFVIPALAGLGAPYWNGKVNGAIFGLTLNTTREHIVRATLESLAYRTKDLIKLMKKDSGIKVRSLAVDGGASANGFLLQYLADVLNINVIRPEILETTALGAGYLAGLASGFWTLDELLKLNRKTDEFTPSDNSQTARKNYKKWRSIVKRML
jgi:glycerol kinase